MSNYDSHLFIKKLQGKNIDVIAKNEEKYIAFSVELNIGTFENKKAVLSQGIRAMPL